MPHKSSEIKEVKLKDHPFLLSLTEQGMNYQGYDPETVIQVAAGEGNYNDWTAYYETPFEPFPDVLAFGNKLPQDVARDLFPEWAKRLKWRR